MNLITFGEDIAAAKAQLIEAGVVAACIKGKCSSRASYLARESANRILDLLRDTGEYSDGKSSQVLVGVILGSEYKSGKPNLQSQG